MENINLNIKLESNEEIDVIISELLDKEEFICTLDACGGHACGIYNV